MPEDGTIYYDRKGKRGGKGEFVSRLLNTEGGSPWPALVAAIILGSIITKKVDRLLFFAMNSCAGGESCLSNGLRS